jgi:hypothetical protein
MKIKDDNVCSLNTFLLSFYVIILCDLVKTAFFRACYGTNKTEDYLPVLY